MNIDANDVIAKYRQLTSDLQFYLHYKAKIATMTAADLKALAKDKLVEATKVA